MQVVEFNVVLYSVAEVSEEIDDYKKLPENIRNLLLRGIINGLLRVVDFGAYFEEELSTSYEIFDGFYNPERGVLNICIKTDFPNDKLIEELGTIINDADNVDLEVLIGKEGGITYFLRVEGVITD